jgi:hypothetical protein
MSRGNRWGPAPARLYGDVSTKNEGPYSVNGDRFDLLVVGGGPAGIAAAVSAAERGRSVALLDENAAPGGQIWRVSVTDASKQNADKSSNVRRSWLVRLRNSGVNVVSSARVLGAIDSGNLLVEVSGLPMHYLGDSIVLATGARERFLPFPGWTLPNVVGAGGLQALVQGGLPIAGKRVILAGSGPLLLAVAAHLLGHGANVAMILEQTPLMLLAKMGASLLSHPDKLVQGNYLSLADSCYSISHKRMAFARKWNREDCFDYISPRRAAAYRAMRLSRLRVPLGTECRACSSSGLWCHAFRRPGRRSAVDNSPRCLLRRRDGRSRRTGARSRGRSNRGDLRPQDFLTKRKVCFLNVRNSANSPYVSPPHLPFVQSFVPLWKRKLLSVAVRMFREASLRGSGLGELQNC